MSRAVPQTKKQLLQKTDYGGRPRYVWWLRFTRGSPVGVRGLCLTHLLYQCWRAIKTVVGGGGLQTGATWERMTERSLYTGRWWVQRGVALGAVVQLVEYRTRNQAVAGSTHTRSTTGNLEQVANLLRAQANSASYPQRDGKWVATGWRPSVVDWGDGVCYCTVGLIVR